MDKNDLPLIDKLVSTAGYTKAHYLSILFTAIVLFIDGIHMAFINSLFIPIQTLYELSEIQIGMISSSMFIAVGGGAFLSASSYLEGKRRVAIIWSVISITIFNILMGLVQNLLFFIVMRFFIGICVGIIMPFINNLLCEILPIKLRSFFLVANNTMFNFAGIFLNMTIYFIMPELSPDKCWIVILIMAIPSGIGALLLYLQLIESPRYLILMGESDAGFEVLETLTTNTVTSEQRKQMTEEILEGANKKVERRVSALLSARYFPITWKVFLIWVFNAFIGYGGLFVLAITIKYLETLNQSNASAKLADEGNVNQSIVRDQILVYVIGLPGSIIAGVMTETRFFGRKMTIFTGYLLSGICCIVGILDVNHFAIYFGIAGICIALSMSGSTSYSCEIYPTKIRDLALGFLYLGNRLSGFLSQYISILLFQIHYLGQFYAITVCCIIGCLITWKLPYDTYGKALDTDSEIVTQDAEVPPQREQLLTHNN